MKFKLFTALIFTNAICLTPALSFAGGADSDPKTVEIKVTMDADGGGVIDDGETSETFSGRGDYKKKLGDAVARAETAAE